MAWRNGNPRSRMPRARRMRVSSRIAASKSSTCSRTPLQKMQSYVASAISGMARTSITRSQPGNGVTSDDRGHPRCVPATTRSPRGAPDSPSALPRACVELRVMAEDVHLVERLATRRREICGDPRPCCDGRTQRAQARDLRRDPRHRARKRVRQPLDDLEHREIDVRDFPSDQVGAVVVLERALEVAEELRQALTQKVRRAFLRLAFLILVIQPAGDRVMGVVYLGDEVGERELQ